jgi:TonB-linked SusC/RagA family outer membrane protein
MYETLLNWFITRKVLSVAVLSLCVLLIGYSAKGQQATVSGTVSSADGPLPGVGILEKGTSQGTATDQNGEFKMNVGPSAVLVFSFIGFQTQEIPVNGQTVINVRMVEDVTALQEIVVTALGVKKETKSLGYAVQSVQGEEMTKAREPNIMNSLTGKVAGLQIQNQTDLFQNPVISLRGATPLIVIDGVPSVDNDIWKVNADDIESFSVLKGANASALYGSIGRNGAIMITTKRGARDRTEVQVNSSTMFQPSFIRIPEVQTTYGNGYNGQYAYVDGSGSGTEGGGWIWGPKLDQSDPSTPSGYWETTQFNSPVDPDTGELIPLPFLSRGKNNVEDFFRTGLIATNNISVSGGGENSNFRLSVANTYQKGIVPNTQLNNTSYTVSGGFKLTEHFKADASLTYNRQYTDNFPETGYGPTNYLYNLVLWTGPDVDVNDLENYWVEGQEGLQQRHFNRSWYNNPYFQANEYLRGYTKDNVFGQIKLDYNILPGLDLSLRTGINQYSLNRTWKEPKSYVAYDYLSTGNYSKLDETSMNINTDFIATYNKKFSEDVALTVSAGGANRWKQLSRNFVKTDGLVIPDFYNLLNSANPLQGIDRFDPVNRDTQTEEKVNSVYGTVDLELLGSIYLGFTARNDWVSTLAVENNQFFYPSVSLSGVISEFVDLSGLEISFLKVRGSFSRVTDGKITELDGTLGAGYPYQHIQAYTPGITWPYVDRNTGATINNPSLTFPGTLIDPDIKPESSDTYEIGMDARFFNGRLGLDVALYRIKDFNSILQIPMSSSSGYSYRLENGGEFLRKGMEITLSGTPVKNDELTWDVLVNWSFFHRYLESGSTTNIFIKPGTRTDQIYGFSYMHTPGGQLIMRDDGFPMEDPYTRKLGYYDPDYIFGIQNTLTYKNFILGVSVDGRVGGKMYSTTNQKMWWGGTHPGTVNQFRDDANEGRATYIADGVVVVEGEATFDEDGNILTDSRIYAPNTTPVNYISWNINTSNAHLNHFYDQTFVKLREVTLTYNFPRDLLAESFLKRASISLVGRNLALWSDMPEVDPDTGSDNLQTPSTRNVGFNLNFSF